MTTIRHHEQEYFMNVEVINKFLRRDTAYDVMDKMRRANTDNLQVIFEQVTKLYPIKTNI